ncbi:hypothetical protein BGZ74_011026 [Mortierella antarctica]|nr:hypothetical protein BGZ74_011026 [Mortierella antarctica]
MTDTFRLFCLLDGESTSNAFPVVIESSETVGELKERIKAKKTSVFHDVDADHLTLWCVSIPDPDDDDDNKNDVHIHVDNMPDKGRTKLKATHELSDIFQKKPAKRTIHIIVKRPPQKLELSFYKKARIRNTDDWKEYTASDGETVNLSPLLINILRSDEFAPAPRSEFGHLKNANNLRAGVAISMPSMGQIPKSFADGDENHEFFITEQMLQLWEDMRGDKRSTYRRVLSGPMGVGKSYLSYFLAAKAYVEGWLVLYVSDAGLLDMLYEDESALQLLKLFLALNKDILTGTELKMLVNDSDGTGDISTRALSVIFGTLLKTSERKTLLLVDEHGKLFENDPHVPQKFRSLVPLSSYHWWGEDAKGSRVIFTGAAHGKFEMTILEPSYRSKSLVFVGPLSTTVFSNLLDTYPHLVQSDIKAKVTQITNCVPRELVNLAESVKDVSGPVSKDHLEQWTEHRAQYFSTIAREYCRHLDLAAKDRFHNALLHMFIGATCMLGFERDFFDLGLIYRSKDVTQIGTRCHILCRPAQNALRDLFKMLPLPAATRTRICNGNLERTDFEVALCHQLMCTDEQVELKATDLNGKKPTTIKLKLDNCETLRQGDYSLGPGHDDTLIRCYKGYPRFDFILGRMFIQVSIRDFDRHNSGSAEIDKAFNPQDTTGRNQIEKYLDGAYGSGHRAYVDARTKRFVVTMEDDDTNENVRIVYIRGSPGKPNHCELVKRFPDILHVSFEELKQGLFKNVTAKCTKF